MGEETYLRKEIREMREIHEMRERKLLCLAKFLANGHFCGQNVVN